MYVACPVCGLQYDVSSYNEGAQVRCKCSAVIEVPAQASGHLSCATCGARVPSDTTQCPYCKGAVRRAVCPKCFRGLREDAKFCDHCGSPIRPQALRPPQATGVPCPRCDGKLFHVQLEGYAMDQCGSCGGLWVDRGTVDAIVRDRPQAVETGVRLDLADGSAAQGTITGQFRGRAYLPCPTCKNLMTPRNYARSSGIIIDVCKDHGIWFDAGELNRILEFVAKGGLVQARKKEAEEARQDVQRAKQEAQAAKMQAARMGSAYDDRHGHYSGGGLLVTAIAEGISAILSR